MFFFRQIGGLTGIYSRRFKTVNIFKDMEKERKTSMKNVYIYIYGNKMVIHMKTTMVMIIHVHITVSNETVFVCPVT